MNSYAKYLAMSTAQRRFVPGNKFVLPNGETADGAIIFDIDSTVADTKPWFADVIVPLIEKLALRFGCSAERIYKLFAELAHATSLHEYGFVVEQIADRCPDLGLSASVVCEAADEFWSELLSEHQKIQAYADLVPSLKRIRENCPRLAIIALTDAPDFLVPSRLAHIGALEYFDGAVAIQNANLGFKNPEYLVCEAESRRRMEAAQLGFGEHLQMQVSLAHKHAKPSDVGIGFIMEWLGLSADRVIICGDKETKEGLAAENWHKANPSAPGEITYLRAFYGAVDVMEPKYVELGKKISTMAPSAPKKDHGIRIHADLHKFADIVQHVEAKFRG